MPDGNQGKQERFWAALETMPYECAQRKRRAVLQLPTWKRLPNISQYYGRLARQILSDTFEYFMEQIVSGLLLGIGAALISREVGWIARSGVPWTILVAVIPYAGIILIALLLNAVRAPVKLDNRRGLRVSALRETVKCKFSESRSEAAQLAAALDKIHEDDKQISQRNSAINRLEQQLAELQAYSREVEETVRQYVDAMRQFRHFEACKLIVQRILMFGDLPRMTAVPGLNDSNERLESENFLIRLGLLQQRDPPAGQRYANPPLFIPESDMREALKVVLFERRTGTIQSS